VATIAPSRPSTEHRERLFFFAMAIAIAATIVGGFGIRLALGVTTFADEPWWVHVHAISFMAWVGFYLVQNALIVRGEFQHHRRLGALGAIFAIWVCFVGLALTAQSLATGRSPPFFEPAYFLAQNWLFVTFFAALTYSAIALRNRADWHRRLMLCATLVVGVPGFARWIILLAPPPDALKHLVTIAVFLVPAILFDLVTRGRIHAAYLVGGGAILFLELAAIRLLAGFPPFADLAERIAG
jgi:hypothetical protein